MFDNIAECGVVIAFTEGETQTHLFKLEDAAFSFSMAVQLGERDAVSRLLKTKVIKLISNSYFRVLKIFY